MAWKQSTFFVLSRVLRTVDILQMVETNCCVLFGYISYVTHCCSHIPDKKQMKEGQVLFWLTVLGAPLHHGGEGMTAGMGVQLVTLHPRESGSRQQTGCGASL